jgi:flagellar FliJ protein
MSRIDVVLRVRRAQESIAKGALLKANTALREATTSELEWGRSMQNWGDRRGAADAGSFRAWRSSLQEGNRELERRASHTELASSHHAEAMEEMLESSRRVEVLERLEERLEEAVLAEEMLREQTVIDEIATSAFFRSSR